MKTLVPPLRNSFSGKLSCGQILICQEYGADFRCPRTWVPQVMVRKWTMVPPAGNCNRDLYFSSTYALLTFHLPKKQGIGARDQQMAARSKFQVTNRNHSRWGLPQNQKHNQIYGMGVTKQQYRFARSLLMEIISSTENHHIASLLCSCVFNWHSQRLCGRSCRIHK